MCTLSPSWACFQRKLFEQPEEAFPHGLTPQLAQFIWVLDVIPVQRVVSSPHASLRGCPPADRRAILRAFLAKACFHLPTTRALLDRLQLDPTLRRLCGGNAAKTSLPRAPLVAPSRPLRRPKSWTRSTPPWSRSTSRTRWSFSHPRQHRHSCARTGRPSRAARVSSAGPAAAPARSPAEGRPSRSPQRKPASSGKPGPRSPKPKSCWRSCPPTAPEGTRRTPPAGSSMGTATPCTWIWPRESYRAPP